MSASVIEAKPVLKWRVVDIAVASVIGVASALIYWFVAFATAAPWSLLEGGGARARRYFQRFCGCSPDRSPQSSCASRAPRSMRRSSPACSRHSWATCGEVSKPSSSHWFRVCSLRLRSPSSPTKKWNLGVTVLSGALSGVGCWGYSFFTHLQAIDLGGSYGVVYLITTVLSGALVAGVVMWYLYLGIARTGALDQFASGRAVRGAKH